MKHIALAGRVFGIAAILGAASFGLPHYAAAAPPGALKALDTDNDGVGSIPKRASDGWRRHAAVGFAISQVHAEGTLPDGLVYLRDVDPTITQDIRYAGSNNFVGRPLDGYGAGECFLRNSRAERVVVGEHPDSGADRRSA
jgi:hypothetical protein